MMLAALEQSEPPGRRLLDDDLAARFLPAPTRWLITATPPKLMRRLTMHAIERSGPGMWANFVCRKRYIADKVIAALDDIDAVVILGAGLDTLAYRLARQTRIPIFEVDQPVNVERKAKAVRRVLGELPASVRLVPLDFERDDVLATLTGLGYRADYRTFFVWEAVTQYLTADAVHATLESLRPAAAGSRLISSTASTSTAPSSCIGGFGSGNSCGASGCSPRRLRRSWTDTAGGWWSSLGPRRSCSVTSSQPVATWPHRRWSGRPTPKRLDHF